MLDRNVRHCVSDMGRRFELFVDNGSPRDVARLLRLVGVDCGFFSDRTVTALRLGAVFSNDIIPSVDRLEETISVFSFLRFREGSNNSPRLPSGGWPEAVEAPRFVAAIQWFILDLFGPECGKRSMFYRDLDALRHCLELPFFIAA